MPEPNQCVVCRQECYPPAPQCNYCAEPVCYRCRVESKHEHTAAEKRKFVVGFCFPCGKIQRLRGGIDGRKCAVCDVGWSARAALGIGENADQMICPFCAAGQRKPSFRGPWACARCAMMIV